MNPKKLWLLFAFVIIASFGVLIYFGFEIYQEKPPVPNRVITDSGQVIYSGQQIKES